MRIGEIMEILIRIKDDYSYGDYRKEAVEETCNLLSKLPRMEEATEYEPACGQIKDCNKKDAQR